MEAVIFSVYLPGSESRWRWGVVRKLNGSNFSLLVTKLCWVVLQ